MGRWVIRPTSFVRMTQSYTVPYMFTRLSIRTRTDDTGKENIPTYAPPSVSPTLVQPLIRTSLANARLSPELSSSHMSCEKTDGGPWERWTEARDARPSGSCSSGSLSGSVFPEELGSYPHRRVRRKSGIPPQCRSCLG